MWIGWDSLEENGTNIVDEEEEFWLLQVMAISEVDSSRREYCFGFMNIMGPLHMGKLFGYLTSIFRDDWSKMKKTGKGLPKLGLNWSQERKLDSFEVGFWVCLIVIGWVQTNESVLVSSKRVVF